ncbi:hypothetical protein [Sinomonas atrocyanea]
MVIDPNLALDHVEKRYFAFLRNGDSGVIVLTRVFDGQFRSVGDYEVVLPGEELPGHDATIRERSGDTITGRAAFNAMNNILAAFNWAQHAGFDPDEARDRQLDVEAAIALQADIYVTDNAFALTQTLTGNVFACSVAEALAIIGLQQRLQGRITLDTDPFPTSLGLPAAEYIQAWALLPKTLELFALREDQSGQDIDRWKDLARVGRTRVERCLRARDQILVQSIHPNLAFPFDTVDALVERMALNLSGMFDALARAVNAALSLGCQDHLCSFAGRGFRRTLPPLLRQLVETDRHQALLKTISVLRNTIHHVALSGASAGDDRGRVSENYVLLPTSEAQEFRRHAATLARESRWIASDVDEFGLLLRPVPLIDDLLCESVGLFERLVSVTEWPGTIDETLRIRRDDPGEYWMHYTPTVSLVSRLYGLEPR